MARPRKHNNPVPQPEPLRIPTPDHMPVTITLCGNEYKYTEPETRLQHDKMQGLFLLAAARMNQSAALKVTSDYARRVAEAADPQKEAQTVQREMMEENAALIGAGALLAIEEIFHAVCAGLRLSPGARSYLEDNYDVKELLSAYGIMFGLIQRPFGGTRRGINPASRIQTG